VWCGRRAYPGPSGDENFFFPWFQIRVAVVVAGAWGEWGGGVWYGITWVVREEGARCARDIGFLHDWVLVGGEERRERRIGSGRLEMKKEDGGSRGYG
jgi:hypothetical protein